MLMSAQSLDTSAPPLDLMNPDTLKDRSAAITGSTSGIGLAIAEGLASAGCNVALNGFGDPTKMEQLRADLAARTGVKVTYSPADLSVASAVKDFVRRAETELGAVDILINNVGMQHVAPVDEFPDEQWEKIITLNLSAAFYTTKAALPGMKSRGWGRIINIASAHGLVASPFKSAYVASKHGLVGFTKSVALEVAQIGITCNAICPGYVDTPLVRGQVTDQARVNNMSEDQVIQDIILAAQPSKRFVAPAELAALTLFLCSPAGRSVTGAALQIDGGWTAR